MKSPFEKALAQKYIGQIVDEPLFFNHSGKALSLGGKKGE